MREPTTSLEQSLFDHVNRVARERRLAPAVDDGVWALTYEELAANARRLGVELLGSVSGRDVVVAVRPSVAFLVLQISLAGFGFRIIQLTPGRPDVLKHVIQRTAPAAVIVDEAPSSDIVDSLGTLSDSGIAFVLSARGSLRRIHGNCRAPCRDFNGNVQNVVVCTSGTTGLPKLVELSQRAFIYVAATLSEILQLGGNDFLFHHLPIAQGAGFFLWAGLSKGSRNLIVSDCRSRDLPDALRDSRATAVFTTSPGLYSLVAQGITAHELPSLRTIYYSSGPVSLLVKKSLVEAFGRLLVQDYGLMELPESLTVLTRDDHVAGLAEPEILSSVGRPLYTQRLRLGDRMSTYGDREIEVRSPAMFSGYCNNQSATGGITVDGWFRTRDVGYFDSLGYLHLTGRLGHVARSGGLAIDLLEVEQALLSVEGVLQASVISEKDDRLGERVVAEVRLDPSKGLGSSELLEELRLRLDRKAVPRIIKITS